MRNKIFSTRLYEPAVGLIILGLKTSCRLDVKPLSAGRENEFYRQDIFYKQVNYEGV
jgi:hypothetical protein